MDNAGGSQLPECVIHAAAAYMRERYVQTGAEYLQSREAGDNVKAAHEFVELFVNAKGPTHSLGCAILGASSTALCHALATAYADALQSGDLPANRNEIIISTTGHEANVWPWLRLGTRGFVPRLWNPSRNAQGEWMLDVDALKGMLSERTLLVAFPQVSNILGDVWDAGLITKLAHECGAKTVVDGVAYAPHHLPDVQDLDCDWYVYSTYKVFGPHMGALFGKHEAFAPLTGANHPFIPKTTLPSKFEPGGISHEGAAAINAGYEYACFLAQEAFSPANAMNRNVMVKAFERIEELERPLQRQLMSGLAALSKIQIVGPSRSDDSRVCTVSFLVHGHTSKSVAAAMNAKGHGCKHGHFYSKRLLEVIGIADCNDGVVRVSLAHYNTPEEVQRFLTDLAAHITP